MVNAYRFNSEDVFITCGLAIGSGSDTFLQLRKRKEPFSNNWAEQNGREYDLTESPKFEDRVFRLVGQIMADSEADFWTKWTNLQSIISTPGVIAVEVVELGLTFNCFFREMTNVHRLTRIKSGGQIRVQVEIILQEVQNQIDSDEPFTNAQYTLL
jgi:hypothetical protein